MGKSLDLARTSLLNLCLIIMLVSRWHFFTRVRCSFVQIQRHTYPVIGHCLCIESIWSLLISECLAWELIHLPLETNFTKENNFQRRNDFQMGWSETPVDLKKKRIDHELIAYDWNLFHRVIAFSIIFSPLMYTHDQYCIKTFKIFKFEMLQTVWIFCSRMYKYFRFVCKRFHKWFNLMNLIKFKSSTVFWFTRDLHA